MADPYILKDAQIIDVENGRVYTASIYIAGGVIEALYDVDEELPGDIEAITLKGQFVMPGLIDMHCHINEGIAPQFVASGVTTVRNTAGNVLDLKKMIEAPADALTPRIYSADRMIDGPPGLWGPTSSGNFVTDSPAEARKEVRRQVTEGADFIKVYGWLSKEVMEAVVEETGLHGRKVSCDLLHSREVNALDAAKLGVTWFEHASGFLQVLHPEWYPLAEEEVRNQINWAEPDEEKIKKLCEEMIQYGVKLCPTLVLSDQIMQYPDYWDPKNAITESVRGEDRLGGHWENLSQHNETLRNQTGLILEFTKKVARTYYELGGTVVTGTDTPAGIWGFPGMALHRELELFVEVGFSEMEALQAATSKAAAAIDMTDRGVIKKGAVADLVVLSNNPLDDIRNTKTIVNVIKGGRIYSEAELLSHVPDFSKLEKEYEEFDRKFMEGLAAAEAQN